MADITQIELVYGGTEVEDGTLPFEDMIDALEGFSSAYEKVARDEERPTDQRHSLRVVGLEKGSARIIVEVVDWVVKHPEAGMTLVTGSGLLLGGAYTVLRDLAKVIWARKESKGQPITHNDITIKDSLVVYGNLNLTRKQFEIIESDEIDGDLERLTRPLEQGRGIQNFKLRTKREELVEVNGEEREFFSRRTMITTTIRDGVWLEGRLNSHSKKSNRGMFHTEDGARIRYRYIGVDDHPLLSAYAQDGMVRVLGRVTYQDEQPTSIEIRDIQPMDSADEQLSLPETES